MGCSGGQTVVTLYQNPSKPFICAGYQGGHRLPNPGVVRSNRAGGTLSLLALWVRVFDNGVICCDQTVVIKV